ncbi:MAG: hypothetical protein ACR2JB_04515 [Bryobacteraceae bacterium]
MSTRAFLIALGAPWRDQQPFGSELQVSKYQILPQLGSRIAAELKKTEIQQAINAIAANPESQSESCVKKCLTHIRAVFAMAIDDELLDKMPGNRAPQDQAASDAEA